MANTVTIDADVPLDRKSTAEGFDRLITAGAETARALAHKGLDVSPDQDDIDVAEGIASAYARDPETTAKHATVENVAKLTPASLLIVEKILRDFSQQVVQDAAQIRHLVTNKLLIETENADPKIRMRALELLGKISDVGLFAEKSEITITHQTSDDLRASLKAKLAKLVNPGAAAAVPEDAVVLDGEIIDVTAEMGLSLTPDPLQEDENNG